MSFELSTIFGISFCYLLLLFAIAYCAEQGLFPKRLVEHPLIYVLSLAVYASAFAIYGVIGFAEQVGYAYLNYYTGVAAVFILAPLLLWPLLRICRNYRLNSMADLLTFRFRNQWVGSLTTVFLLLAMTPFLALQIQAVSESTLILTEGARRASVDRENRELLALLFCVVISVFTMLFGSRHLSSRESHRGLVTAVAFESAVKLLALLCAGAVATFGIFGGFSEMQDWLRHSDIALQNLNTDVRGDAIRMMLAMFFAATVCMPQLFHLLFAENPSVNSLRATSWAVPLYLMLASLPILPILWAGQSINSGGSSEYFSLTIGLQSERPWLSILVYLGGLSAASSAIIVATLALANMSINHLILPIYQPGNRVNIYNWMLWMRRALIAAIILGGYLFYLWLPSRNMQSQLGIIALCGCLQLLPGVLAVLYWPRANHRGLIAGVMVGLGIWFVGLLLPTVTHYQPDFVYWIYIADVSEQSSWIAVSAIALGLNILAFIAVSLLTKISDEERFAAEACALDDLTRPARQRLSIHSAREVEQHLASALGQSVANREVGRALGELHLEWDEKRPYALRRLRDRIEINLSALMGPTVARGLVDRALPYVADQLGESEDITFIENRLEQYQANLTGLAADLDNLRRYHRQTLDKLPIGVCAIGRDHELLMWNRVMTQLTGISGEDITGSQLSDLPPTWAEMLTDFLLSKDTHWRRQYTGSQGNARWINLHKASEPAAERSEEVIVMEDITDTLLLETKVTHQERLASIGRLAAGVAHEIGNPVTGIACLAQNLQYDSKEPEALESAEQIIKQTQRINAIVQSLVNFAHMGREGPTRATEAVDIRHCADEAIQLLMLDREATHVRFDNRCTTGTLAFANNQSLLQVFINLLSNARDASPADSTVTVTADRDNGHVRLSICDHGSGIPSEVVDQVFEPFFTTKEPGKGTGLGLALVYNIINDLGGDISIESPVPDCGDHGTCIHIQLQAYDTPV